MTLSSARTAVSIVLCIYSSSSSGRLPRERLARLHTTKSPGLVVVNKTVSPFSTEIFVDTYSIGAMFCAISVHKLEQ